MAESSRERIAQRTIALSVIATALDHVRNGLADQQQVGQASREDWLRMLGIAREKVAQLERDAAVDLKRAEQRRR
jgi:hypothetical protein